MKGLNITSKSLENIGAVFSYTPPTRFLRVSKAIGYPSFMIPTNLLVQDVDIDKVTELVADFLSGRYIGTDLDFYPLLPHDAVDSLDIVRDFQNLAQVKNFYNQVCLNNNPKGFDVSFVADDVPNNKRFCKYSKFILDKSMLHQKAKRMYKAVSITCTSLFDATQEQIEESGYIYSPNNVAKGKLNSRFVDAIKSLNPGYLPLPNSLVVFVKVAEVKDDELKSVHDIVDSDLIQIPSYIGGLDMGGVLDAILEPETV